MNIAAWNVASNDQMAVDYLRDRNVDLAILSEAGETTPDGVVEWHRIGKHPRKGLALASFGPPISDVTEAGGRWSICGVLDSGIGILGIWSNPDGPSGARAYGQEVALAVESSTSFLSERPCVIAGDFNQFSYRPRFAKVVEQLAELGYQSLHHRRTGEPLPGVKEQPESMPTYFHQFNQNKPFHLDYMFVANELLDTVTSFHIDSFDDIHDGSKLISDHAPLHVSLGDQPTDPPPQ